MLLISFREHNHFIVTAAPHPIGFSFFGSILDKYFESFAKVPEVTLVGKFPLEVYNFLAFFF